jgi:dipeptidyl aminopeptidase/acylaminoacyl peptidase
MGSWRKTFVWAVLACAAGGVQALEPVPIEAFAVADARSAPRLSPDGLHVAVSTNLGEGNHAIVVHRVSDMAQTALLKLPRYEVPVQTYWVSNRRLLIAKGRLFGAREKPLAIGEIIATDFDGSNQKYVYGYQQTTRMAGLERGFGYIEGLPLEANNRFYMRRLSGSTRRSMLYDVDTERGTHRLVADIGVKDLGFLLDPSGVPRFASGTDENDYYRLFAPDAAGKDWQPVPLPQMGGKFVPFAFNSDGSEVFAFLSVDNGPASLVTSTPSGENRRTLAHDGFGSVGDVEWNSAWQPFAATLDHGKPRTVYFDDDSVDAREHRMLRGLFPEHYVTYANHSADGNLSLLLVYSDRDPGMWYLFDRKKGTATLLFASREDIDPERMGERRYFRFKASDGMELDGYLTIPAGVDEPSRMPMVLLPHGGPHVEGDAWRFDTDAQFLASRGYLVLQVNYRGTQGRGYRFEQAGFRNWGTRVQDDLIDGVRWAIAQGHADPDRVCAYGVSFGAYSAMMTAARAPELIRCTAGLAGLYDLKVFTTKSDAAISAYGRAYFARAIGGEDVLRAHSPVTLADRIRAPVFLAHGEIDERTPYSQAVGMKKALEAAGRPPLWMSVPREGHGFYTDANNIAFYRRLEAFLAEHIGTQ